MKRILSIIMSLSALLAISACSEFDDIWKELDGLGGRVTKLEEACERMNTNITSLQTLMTALEKKEFITAINEIKEGDVVTGYSISLSGSGDIRLFHGKNGKNGTDGKDGKDGANGSDGKDGEDGSTPVIGVKADTEGVYYWTVNGEWLLDDSGQKVKAEGRSGASGAAGADGRTPQLKIEEGYWFVSYDGESWQKLGKATGEQGPEGPAGPGGSGGDCIFSSVYVGEDSVTFTLADGTEFTVPLYMGVVDLSAQGTANCYIVSRAGKYRFPAIQGNSSTAVGKYTSASSAEVLWESFGTATAPAVGDLISDVSFSAGYISFTASSRRGNAVIAAKDSYGDILWSWHIWLTERPEDQVYKNNAGTMMDRNLGATSATPGDAAALGLLYQWGRKDPFLGNSSIPDESIPYECIPAVSTNSSIWSITTSTTIDDSVLYPTTFITENANNDDWLYSRSETTDNSRWQPTKTIYDPCPPGYCVPHIYVWHDAFNAASGEIQNIYYFKGIPYNNESKGFNFFKYLTSSGSCWYPLTSIIGPAGVPAQLTRCYYWSSSPNFYYSANYALGCCMSLLSEDAYGDERINPVYAIDRACGLSVRCLKE